MSNPAASTHNKAIGYIFWFFGFTGAHRFYYGRPLSGMIWLLTGGLFGVGWLYDFCTLNGQIDERNYPQLLSNLRVSCLSGRPYHPAYADMGRPGLSACLQSLTP